MIRYLIRDLTAMAAAVAASLAAAAVLPFLAGWPDANVALLLAVVVVAVATGNRAAGGLAVAGLAVWFGFFFAVPYERFTIRSSPDVTTFALLLVVGVAVSQPSACARRLKVTAITDAQIRDSSPRAQGATFPDAVAEHAREQLIGLLDLQECRGEYGTLVGHPPRLEPGWTVLAGHGCWDAERPGLPGEEVELRIFGSGQHYGRFMLTPGPGSRLSLHARLVAVTLADQAGRGLVARVQALSTR
jgi:hypothetical protein